MGILFAATGYHARRLSAPSGVGAAYCQCAGDRDEQQDACGLFTRGESMLAVVADGMGGLARGGVASRLAVDAAGLEADELLASGASFDTMKRALERINAEVYRSVMSFGAMGVSGTTFCAAVVERRRLRLFWCGDSRVYLWRGGTLAQLTDDHIYSWYLKEMVAEGVISVADARAHPAKGRLTGYIGTRWLEDYSITPEALALQGGDSVLLCTDGLYKCLDPRQIGECMAGSARESAGALIQAVAKRNLKGQDNATALVLRWVQ